MEVLHENDLPGWLVYPPEYLRVIAQGFVKIEPWYFLDKKLAAIRLDGLSKRYPGRQLFAFAARFDSDDIACWEKNSPGKILVIHDFAAPGYERRGEYGSFWDWFRVAIEDMIAFEA